MKPSQITLLILVVAIVVFFLGQFIHTPFVKIKTVTQTVSVLEEKKKCDDAGGNFNVEDNFGYFDFKTGDEVPEKYELKCTKTNINQIFDYKISK